MRRRRGVGILDASLPLRHTPLHPFYGHTCQVKPPPGFEQGSLAFSRVGGGGHGMGARGCSWQIGRGGRATTHHIPERGCQFMNDSQKCEAVPRRARIRGSYTCASLNSRLESHKEKKKGEGWHGMGARGCSWCDDDLRKADTARGIITCPS